MLHVLGGKKRTCDGITRRDLLHVGGLGLLGGGLAGAGGIRLAEAATDRSSLPGFGRAKACILLYLYGAPSQIETFDPKPEAPDAIRGEFGCIPTVVPGINLCEGLPLLAGAIDRATIVRSMSHDYPIHGVAYALTGIPQIELSMELTPRDSRHWPFIGSVVDHLDEVRSGGEIPEIPRNLGLPWAFSSRRIGEVPRAGPYGGFLGPGADPVWAEFAGEGTVKAVKTLTTERWEDYELYRGVAPGGRFELSSVDGLGPSLTIDRLDRRRTLLEQIEAARPSFDRPEVERKRSMAYAVLDSRPLREAFDLGREPSAIRERYGLSLFGQAALTARRLVEAGGRFVSVFWDEYGLAGSGWDTHWDHYSRMRDELLPGLDRTLSGLLIDLDERGLLDETLVLCLSEHGRTPKITPNQGGGRDHWSRCYSVLLAGGGVPRGQVVGRSDRVASDPIDRPVSPKDILATAYHLLGIDPRTEIHDRQGRPLGLVPTGSVIPELLEGP